MKKIALIFVTIILLPIQVYADSIILNCPDKVDEQVDFTCELSGYTDTAVSSLSAQVSLSDDMSFIAFIPKNVWKGDGADGNIELYTADIQKGSFPIGTIKLKKTGNDSATIKIGSVFFYDENIIPQKFQFRHFLSEAHTPQSPVPRHVVGSVFFPIASRTMPRMVPIAPPIRPTLSMSQKLLTRPVS